MNPLAEMVFISEIVLQSKIAQRAADRLPNEPSGFDRVEVWCSIQSILVAAGNVSKILWPPKNKNKAINDERIARGEKLRKMLNVDDYNVLSNREFRNHFEHYDERIEDWFANRKSPVYTDLAFNPFKPNKWSFPKYYHRAYNQVDRILTFRGETLDLIKVLDALEEIRLKCGPYDL